MVKLNCTKLNFAIKKHINISQRLKILSDSDENLCV